MANADVSDTSSTNDTTVSDVSHANPDSPLVADQNPQPIAGQQPITKSGLGVAHQDSSRVSNSLQNPSLGPDWWIMFPWILPIITLLGGYWLGRRNTILNNVVTLTLDDITTFREKIDQFIPLVKAHQRGTPCGETTTLEKSRENLTELRKTAASIHRQIHGSFQKKADKEEWMNAYRDWKEATEGETGWIINKKKKWSDEGIHRIEQASESYSETISRFRRRVAGNKLPILKH
jgi:hypothetical protein